LYEEYEKEIKFGEVKTHAMWFVKRLKYAKSFKQQIIKTENLEQLKGIIDSI